MPQWNNSLQSKYSYNSIQLLMAQRYRSPNMSNELETYEANTRVFLVKIWVEERTDGKMKTKWRGHIVHIPSNERRYFSDLFDIILFVLPYLGKMGIRISLFWQIINWSRSKRKNRDKEAKKLWLL
jgi:hypothetical protein